MKENWEKVTMITIDDKLEALSETERGALCSHTYHHGEDISEQFGVSCLFSV